MPDTSNPDLNIKAAIVNIRAGGDQTGQSASINASEKDVAEAIEVDQPNLSDPSRLEERVETIGRSAQDLLPELLRLAREVREIAFRGVIDAPAVRIVPRPGPWQLVEITKQENALRVAINASDDNFLGCYNYGLPVIVYLASQTAPSVQTVWANLDDRCAGAIPGNLGYCANDDSTILIPDSDFFRTRGYEEMRAQLGKQLPWHERQNVLIWRGSTTGVGKFPDDGTSLDTPGVLPRLQMCAILKSQPDVDAKIYQCVQEGKALHERRLRAEGLFDGSRIHETAWLDRKYALDIDGNSNAFTNLFIRLLFGCCVIKVSSPEGFRQWYYDWLEPWRHYVPVSSDLSDLVDVIKWCRKHEDACARIAAAGQALVTSMTPEAELRDAIWRINERLGNLAS